MLRASLSLPASLLPSLALSLPLSLSPSLYPTQNSSLSCTPDRRFLTSSTVIPMLSGIVLATLATAFLYFVCIIDNNSAWIQCTHTHTRVYVNVYVYVYVYVHVVHVYLYVHTHTHRQSLPTVGGARHAHTDKETTEDDTHNQPRWGDSKPQLRTSASAGNWQ